MTRSLRTHLDVAVWDALATLAADDGVSIATYAARVLGEHIDAKASKPWPGPISDALWSQMLTWYDARPTLIDSAPRTSRAAVLGYATAHGFRPVCAETAAQEAEDMIGDHPTL